MLHVQAVTAADAREAALKAANHGLQTDAVCAAAERARAEGAAAASAARCRALEARLGEALAAVATLRAAVEERDAVVKADADALAALKGTEADLQKHKALA